MDIAMPPTGLRAAGDSWDGILDHHHHPVTTASAKPTISPHASAPTSLSRHTRSTTHLKTEATDRAVISSIISSLAPNNHLEGKSGAGSRTYQHSNPSTASSFIQSSISTHAPAFRVEYGNRQELDDEASVSDAALSPTIPTSRAAFGSGARISPPPPSLPQLSSNHPLRYANSQTQFRSRPTSRGSSRSGKSERNSGAKNKLSSESWVRKSASETADVNPPRGRPQRKSLRRVNSQETLRPPHIESLLNQESDRWPAPVSRGEQFASKTTLKTPTKERLYLSEPTASERAPALEPVTLGSSKVLRRNTASAKSIEGFELALRSDNQFTPPADPPQPTASPISDSIPTRTSSLRQSSSSPASSRRKSKKSKKPTMNRTESVFSQRSRPIPESSWADLGDDDETVRRIRELREQRELRLERLQLYAASQVPMPPMQASGQDVTIAALSARKKVDENTVHRSSKIVPTQATTEQEISDQTRTSVDVQESTETRASGIGHDRPVDAFQSINYSLDAKRPLSPQMRPPTSVSDVIPTPTKLSLDYSYADAVHALQRVEAEADRQNDHPALLSVPPSKSKRNRLEKSRVPSSPLSGDLERKKSRRRSLGDNRHKRMTEEDQESSPRDSIEIRVSEYLDAPRLTQTVYNPISKRTICFSDVGDPKGAAVFVCVGMGLTRYVTAFYDELATTLRLRLITIDRPGVGGSAPYAANDKSGPLNWPEDVLAICQHLGITKFSVLAHSAGAVYALATALIFPQMIKGKIHLLAPWIPPSQLEAIPHQTASSTPVGALPRSQRFLRVLPPSFLKAANSSFMSSTSGSKPTKQRIVKNGSRSPRAGADGFPAPVRERPMSQDRPEYNRRESMLLMDHYMPSTNPLEAILDSDGRVASSNAVANREILDLSATATPMDPSFTYAATALNAAEHTEKERHRAYTRHLTERTWALATRDSSPATDLLVCLERHRTVGFRYTDVNRELVVTHGAEDKRVPVANVRWLAQQINTRAPPGDANDDDDGGGGSVPASREGWADAASAGPGCEVRILHGEGHGLMANPAIMGDILTEIAGYWVSPDPKYGRS